MPYQLRDNNTLKSALTYGQFFVLVDFDKKFRFLLTLIRRNHVKILF